MNRRSFLKGLTGLLGLWPMSSMAQKFYAPDTMRVTPPPEADIQVNEYRYTIQWEESKPSLYSPRPGDIITINGSRRIPLGQYRILERTSPYGDSTIRYQAEPVYRSRGRESR